MKDIEAAGFQDLALYAIRVCENGSEEVIGIQFSVKSNTDGEVTELAAFGTMLGDC